MNDVPTKNNWVAVAALIVSIFSLLGALAIGGATLYYGHLRDASIITSTGSYVYVQGRPWLGLPLTFFNDGARAGVINSGSLTLNDGTNTFYFDLKLFAPSAEKWIAESGLIKPVPMPLSFFSPVTVKAGDASEGVFWFVPQRSDFKFRADTKYNAEVTLWREGPDVGKVDSYGPLTALQLASARVQFQIDSQTAITASQNRETTIPVPVIWPRHP